MRPCVSADPPAWAGRQPSGPSTRQTALPSSSCCPSGPPGGGSTCRARTRWWCMTRTPTPRTRSRWAASQSQAGDPAFAALGAAVGCTATAMTPTGGSPLGFSVRVTWAAALPALLQASKAVPCVAGHGCPAGCAHFVQLPCAQAIARSHRIGQTREVRVFHMEAVADLATRYSQVLPSTSPRAGAVSAVNLAQGCLSTAPPAVYRQVAWAAHVANCPAVHVHVSRASRARMRVRTWRPGSMGDKQGQLQSVQAAHSNAEQRRRQQAAHGPRIQTGPGTHRWEVPA